MAEMPGFGLERCEFCGKFVGRGTFPEGSRKSALSQGFLRENGGFGWDFACF